MSIAGLVMKKNWLWRIITWMRASRFSWLFVLLSLCSLPSMAGGTIAVTSTFVPADATRTWMDVGGVWNGSLIISPSDGDAFTFSLTNSGTTSFDIKPNVTIPSDLTVVLSGANAPTVSGNASCLPAPTLTSATLSGGVLTYTLGSTGVANSGYDMAVGCTLTLQFKAMANTSATAGTKFLILNWSQSSADGGVADAAPTPVSQSVQVNLGASTLDKLPTNQIRAVGDTAQWLTSAGQGVTVLNTGLGGLFNVQINESAINPGGNLALTSLVSTTSGATCSAGICTLPYLASGASFKADVQATVTGCTAIGNTVNTTDLTTATAKSRFAQVTLNLPAPQVSLTVPSVTLGYSGSTPVTVTVANASGAGTAVGLTLDSNLPSLGLTVSGISAGWSYNSTTGLFTYTGTSGNLTAGTTLTLTFNVQSANVCTPSTNTLGIWTVKYTNSCGAIFAVPTVAMNFNPATTVPSITLGKVATPNRAVVGEPSTYTINLNAANTALISGTNLVVTDTLPAGITGVSLSPSAGSVVCSGACTAGSLVTWTVPKANVPASLTINFTAPAGVCTAGSSLTNTASISATSVAACSLSTSATASQLLTNNPGGSFTQDYNLSTPTGSYFETGTPDTNNNGVRDNREGEFVTATASYSWGVGSVGTFGGTTNSTYADNFSNFASAQLLSSYGVQVRLANTSTGAFGSALAVPTSAITCTSGSLATNNCQGGFSINLSFLQNSGFFNDNNVADKRLELSYKLNFPDAAVPDTGTASRTTLATLVITNSTVGCAGTTYTQGDFVALARARADVAVSIPQTLDICQSFTASATVSNRNEESISNLVLNLLNGSGPYAISSTPTVTPSGFFTGTGTWSYNSGVNPTFTLPAGVKMTSSGGLSWPAYLAANATTTPTAFTARADYDDLQTSGTTTPDFTGATGQSGSATPQLVRSAKLSVTVSPQSVTISGNKTQWLVYVTNIGNGVATNVSVSQAVPAGLTVNLTDTNSANTPIAATLSGSTVTFAVGTLQPGQQVALKVMVDVSGSTCSISGSTPLTTTWGCGTPFVAAQTINSTSPNFLLPSGQLDVSTDSSRTACPLCGIAEHVVRVRNTGQTSVYNAVINEISEPSITGLTLAAIEFSVDSGATFTAVTGYTGAGTAASPYVVNSSNIATLAELVPPAQATTGVYSEVLVRFRFSTSDQTNASTQSVTTKVQATTACGATVSTGNSVFSMAVKRPDITVSKAGVNRTVDGGATTTGTYTNPVYAGSTDVVEWRVTVVNSGSQAAQNVRLTDLFAGSGATTMQLCSLSGGCANDYATATTISSNTPVVLPNLAAGETRVLYLKEVVGNACLSASPISNNTAKINWGCTPTSVLATPTTNSATAQLITTPAFTTPTVVITLQNNGRAMVVFSVTNNGASVTNPVISAFIPTNALLDTSYGSPAAATLVAPSSVTGLTLGGTTSAPTWTLNGAFRKGQSVTLTYYVLPTNGAGAPFNDTTAATLPAALSTTELNSASGLDPVATTAKTLTMTIAAITPCPVTVSRTASLDLAIPDLDFLLALSSAPGYLVNANTTGGSFTLPFRITNNGEVESVADNFEFFIPLAGTGWTFSSSTSVVGSGASQTSYTCVASGGGGDQKCTFVGSIPRSGLTTLNVNVVLSDMTKPLAFSPELHSYTYPQASSTAWGTHSFDRIAYRVIGAYISKSVLAATDTSDTLTTGTSNVTVGEEAKFTNTLRLFGAGSNTVSSIVIRDNLSTTAATDDVLGYVSHVVTSGSATAITPTGVIHGPVQLTFDDVVGMGTKTFTLTARALNVAGLTNGTTATNNLGAQFVYLGTTFMTNKANDTFTAVSGSYTSASLHTQATLSIRKPTPTITQQVRNRTQNGIWSSAINANAGDVIEFRVVVSNPSTALAPMRNLVISNTLDANLTPIALASDALDNDGDATGSEGNITGQVVSFDETSASNTKLATLVSGSTTSSTLTVTFAATSNVSIAGGTVINNTASLTWSSLPGTDATSYSSEQSTLPGVPGALSGEYVETLTTVATINFARASGRVYVDANHNGTQDSGETLGTSYSAAPSSGPQLYAKLLRSGVFYGEVAVSADGSFVFGTLPIDPNWRLIITTVAGSSALTAQLPPGYVGTQNPNFYADFATGTNGTLMPPFRFGIYRGARIDGQVIRDNGTGAGTAFDAALNGTEIPLAAVSVCLTTLTTCSATALDSTQTGADGRFSLYVPPTSMTGVLNVVETNLTNYLSASGVVGTLPSASYTLATDVMGVAANGLAVGNIYTGLVFGDILPNSFNPDNTRQTLPGTEVFLPHRYVAQAPGTVTFTIASGISSPAGLAFNEVLFRDDNCNGTLDAGEQILSGPIAMQAPNVNTAAAINNPNTATPSLVCLLVREFVPAEAGQGASRTVTPQASYTYAGGPSAQVLTAQDITTVNVGATDLELVKSVDLQQANKGATLTYTIVFTNHSTKPLTTLKVQDAVPPYTGFMSASWAGTPASLGTCTKTSPVALTAVGCAVTTGENPAVGTQKTGAINWMFTGTLNPGDSGSVIYKVRIDE